MSSTRCKDIYKEVLGPNHDERNVGTGSGCDVGVSGEASEIRAEACRRLDSGKTNLSGDPLALCAFVMTEEWFKHNTKSGEPSIDMAAFSRSGYSHESRRSLSRGRAAGDIRQNRGLGHAIAIPGISPRTPLHVPIP
ncbi:hypothetical protein M8818_003206 [Zalaria obscura]|uniref:Uncharacterized protein n=1 Tax=Zalaria obscura TaxID=2024903 RepID=A0ACC3SFC8_9PEZI